MENTKVKQMFQTLENLSALQMLDDERVRSSFVRLYLETHPGEGETTADIFFERESHFFRKILLASDKLQQATRFSLYSCLLDVVTNGMTFDPSMALMYIETRNVNTAPQGQQARWEVRANNKLTASGELNLRMQLNQIKYADLPVIVYDGDKFSLGSNEKGKYAIWEKKFPESDKIIASFIRITRPDGSIDIAFLTDKDIERFKAASQKQNTRGNQQGSANPLYTSVNGGIDPGFLATKTIRHAFRTFPKARIIGSNTVLEDDESKSVAEMTYHREDQQEEPGAGDQSQQAPAITSNPGSQESVNNNSSPGVSGITMRDINF